MAKENSWLDQNLSDFVKETMARGLIPVFQFVDKDKIETHEAMPPIGERTPLMVLEKELKDIIRMRKKIESREGITIPEDRAEEVTKNLSNLVNDLIIKELEFENAIKKVKA